ncbi:MAG: HAMP domain-containing histidine kinase [Acetatifactor sp.]|nr:HAMP domain-containing histidine kinase [Acetatifactor sp.]
MIQYINSDYGMEVNFHEETETVEGISGSIRYFTRDITFLFTPVEDLIYNILGIMSVAFWPVCFGICIGITSLLFYKGQIQEPLEILDRAADNIADNNLDFKIVYDSQNELGKLCSSFEKMRAALQDNNIEMWRQIEERKRLNTAFAHDLRTPLTVLKGQSEMLIKYFPQMPAQKVISTAEMMQRHITRLEAYVDTMNDLQRLEDIEVDKRITAVSDVIDQMHSTGISVCRGKNFIFNNSTAGISGVNLDFGIVMRVYENLLSNALRFAQNTVKVFVEVKEHCFQFTVSDDGSGFTDKDILNAVKPFYKAGNETDNKHFGMGLNICKILCEKHGGHLELKNDGGAVVLAVFGQ